MRTELVKVEVPPGARTRCLRQKLPDRDLTEAESTDLWAIDRDTIEKCDQRRAAAVAAIDGTVP